MSELVKKALSAKDLSYHVPNKTIFELQLLDLVAQASVAMSERDGNAKDDDEPLHIALSMLEEKFSILETQLARFKGSLLIFDVDVCN